jgi:hypothetical protein
VPNHQKSKNKPERNTLDVQVDDGKQCPFIEHYDGYLLDVLANLRCFASSRWQHRDISAVWRSCLFVRSQGDTKILGEGVNHGLFSYSAQGLILRQEFVLNKNIVHLIDENFWNLNLGFKHETQAEMVIPMIYIISIISIMHIMCMMPIISIIHIIAGSKISTCGPRVDGQEEVKSPKP